MPAETASPLSILIVEDQDDTAQSTAELVSLWGYSVRVANTGPAALKEVADQMPDVVLLDIGLPGMDGWKVAKRMRDGASGKQPFIVAVTAYAEESDKWRSADAGVDMHWVKPASPAALAEMLGWVRELLSPTKPEAPRTPAALPAR
jgi:CheY-like chemotaxis protein